MKVKLEDWNEIWKKLEGQFCILAFLFFIFWENNKLELKWPKITNIKFKAQKW